VHGIEYVLADLRTHPFQPESFDFVASVAVLHHMDAATGLRRMAELLRPGGVLVVVGLARMQPPGVALAAASVLVEAYHRLTKTYWEHGAPTVWPPPETYFSMWRIARRTLPGARFRRHLLHRYSLTWTRGPHPLAPVPAH
jgi:SAM-dependent methyltransferase